MNSARQVGGSLSLAVLGTISYDRFAQYLRVSGAHPTAKVIKFAYVSGYTRAFEVSAAITVVAFLVSLALPSKVGHHSSHAKPADAAAAASAGGH